MTQPRETRHIVGDYFFINNCLGSFFKGVLNWFGDEFYPRFNYKVIGTYDKAVEFFNKQKQTCNEPNSPLTPSITLDPTLDFSQEERGGKFLWQNQHLAPHMAIRLFDPIDLKEQDVYVTPVFSRYQGSLELIFWMDSVYEYLDFRTMLLQFTGGYGRIIRPAVFWSFIIVPDEVKDFKTGETTTLDWGNTDASFIHIDNINQEKFAIPVVLTPMLKLESFADASTKYGGDQIAEYKLSATFAYEIELPTYMVLTHKIGGKLVLSVSLGNTFSKYGFLSPRTVLKEVANIDSDYSDIKRHMNLFEIPQNEIDSSTEVFEDSLATTYPEIGDIIDWNTIRSGTLIQVTNSSADEDVQKGDIIYCDTFSNSMISFLRRCGAMICRNGRKESLGYIKCELLKKPIITGLSDESFSAIVSHVGEDITVDTLNKKVYSGILSSEQIERDQPGWGRDALAKIEEDDPKLVEKAKDKAPYRNEIPELYAQTDTERLKNNLISDGTDGIITDYRLPFVSVSPETISVLVDEERQQYETDYTINEDILSFIIAPPKGSVIRLGGEYMPFYNVTLIAIYEFTEPDLELQEREYINIDLPFDIKSNDELILVSYIGEMEYERDYDIDIENNILILKIKPKLDELVEIFKLIKD